MPVSNLLDEGTNTETEAGVPISTIGFGIWVCCNETIGVSSKSIERRENLCHSSNVSIKEPRAFIQTLALPAAPKAKAQPSPPLSIAPRTPFRAFVIPLV